MTHITEARVIGNRADMGGLAPAAARIPLTMPGVLRAGRRRMIGRREIVAARSTWDSEARVTAWLRHDSEGQAPPGLGC
jgi:hypothetical protein